MVVRRLVASRPRQLKLLAFGRSLGLSDVAALLVAAVRERGSVAAVRPAQRLADEIASRA
jgi:hypothetical protein